MAQWPGLGDRIRQRLVELDYKQANGKPDILGFSLKHSYLPMYLYKWANAGVMPSRENVERLAKDLHVPAPWLLFGDEVNKAPVPPRKRGVRNVRCWVAALSFAAMGVVPGRAAAQDLGHGLTPPAADTSYRKWRGRYLWRWLIGNGDTAFGILRWGTL